MSFLRRPLALLIPVMALSLMLGGSAMRAQLDGADRGIAPMTARAVSRLAGSRSTSRAANAEAARSEGWRRAQLLGWRRSGRAPTTGPSTRPRTCPNSTLDPASSPESSSSRSRSARPAISPGSACCSTGRGPGSCSAFPAQIRRSAPMLLIPVMMTGSTSYSFEFRNLWQRAWAEYRTAGSTDRLCPHRRARDRSAAAERRPDLRRGPRLVADAARPIWRGRHHRSPRSTCRRLYPGGPAIGIFTARYGPDGTFLGRFVLRAANSGAIRTMLDEGVRRLDGLYRQALGAGPAPARSEPRHPRRAAAARAGGGDRGAGRRQQRRRPPRSRPRPAGRDPELQRPGRDAGRRLGAARRARREPGRRRHLGDHHQPRARRHLGDGACAIPATPPPSPPRSAPRAGASRW